MKVTYDGAHRYGLPPNLNMQGSTCCFILMKHHVEKNRLKVSTVLTSTVTGVIAGVDSLPLNQSQVADVL